MVDLYNDDCLNILKTLSDDSLDLLITSPPYYNAREYSHWNSVNDYMNNMKEIFSQVYCCLKNHHYIVVNICDVVTQVGSNMNVTSKLPLGAMFIVMLQEIGFIYQEDFIWDKGEVQSNRMKGNPPYPFYQYPCNCYEHILIFVKHELDNTKLKCPICNSDNVVINGLVGVGEQSFECKNPNCPSISDGGRGKRFSARSIMMNNYQKEENKIGYDLIKKWRRDIVKINPIVKINSKGENLWEHSAPFPTDIPRMAIKFFSGVGDTVMDCFLGSGTSGIVAKELHRNFIGVELNKEYFELAKDRIEKDIFSL